MVNSVEILKKYYDPDGQTLKILLDHGRAVARKALAAAQSVAHLNPNPQFIEEAAMLHDIGIFMTYAPELGCSGKEIYVSHGYLGRKLLESIDLPKHGRVCERHVGVGITQDDIQRQNLPLPMRDMQPLTIEEQLVCYADKFFSKNGNGNGHEKSVDQVALQLAPYGDDKVAKLLKWAEIFESP
jgi:uncharacterized protein